MSDSPTTATPETKNSAPMANPLVRENQMEAEVDRSQIAGQRVMRSMGGASPMAPPDRFAGTLGQMQSASGQAGMLRQLQRGYGNSYVGNVIQRKADGNGTCTDCEKKEKEIQRKGEGEVSAVPDGFEAAMQRSGAGHPLDEGTRSFMESRFGQGFGDVKVHTDSAAAEASQQIQAQAFTTGRDIYFSRGRYQPEATEGKKLLAHELTHTIQQKNLNNVQPKLDISSPSDPLEQAADNAAAKVLSSDMNRVDRDYSSLPKTTHSFLTNPLIQRDFDLSAGGKTSPTAPASIPVSPGSPEPNSSSSSPAILAERKLIDEALESKDVGDVKLIKNFGLASEEEKFKLIGILLDQTWVGPYDEYALEAIWGSFGERLIKVASAHLELWNKCIEWGAELENLPAVKQLSTWFLDDTKTLANNYLDTNKALVENEMTNAGIPFQEGEQPAPANQEQTQKLEKMQSAAKSIAHFQEQLELSRQVYVGYSLGNIPPESKRYWLPVMFDPFRPPERLDPPEFDPNDPSPMKQQNPVYKIVPTQPYEVLLSQYKLGMHGVRELVNKYPMVYAISREDSSAATKVFAETKDPALARNQLAGALRRLRNDINQTKAKLGKELDPLDLIPLHQQLFGGVKVENIQGDWSLELPQQIARHTVGSHDLKNALAALALETVSQMAFMISGVTGDSGMVALLAVGFVAAKIKADISTEQYQALLQASKTAVAPETDLVTPQQVDEAKAQSDADQAALALATINTAVGITGAMSSWAGRKISALQKDSALAKTSSTVPNDPKELVSKMFGGDDNSSVWKPLPPSINNVTGEVVQMVLHTPTGEIYTVRFNPSTGNGSITHLATGQTAIISGGKILPLSRLLPSETTSNVTLPPPSNANSIPVGSPLGKQSVLSTVLIDSAKILNPQTNKTPLLPSLGLSPSSGEQLTLPGFENLIDPTSATQSVPTLGLPVGLSNSTEHLIKIAEGSSTYIPRQLMFAPTADTEYYYAWRPPKVSVVKWNKLLRDMYQFKPPTGGGTVKMSELLFTYDAQGNLTQVMTNRMMFGTRVSYFGTNYPQKIPGFDYGHLGGVSAFGINDWLAQSHGGFPMERVFNRTGAWAIAEGRSGIAVSQLAEQGKPFLKVAQARGFVSGVPSEVRIYVESAGNIVYDSGWMNSPLPSTANVKP